VGLAAPQVGVNIRLMVFNPYGRERPGNESILVNPEIISISDKLRIKMEEGCLSFPKMYGPIEVRAQGAMLHPQLVAGCAAGRWISSLCGQRGTHRVHACSGGWLLPGCLRAAATGPGGARSE
jgi:hypothetical protein